MAVAIAFLLFVGIISAAIVLTFSRVHGIYFLLDSAVITFFFVYGTMNEWNLRAWHVTGYYGRYIFMRLLIAIVIYIIMKLLKRKISFGGRSIAGKIIIIINIIVNTIFYYPLMGQMWGVAGI